ncbi:hypothetical protein CLOM_g1354 [Closterium sp. NIES-68]|nr:hypothetical protein CLOM_g1354 [Closterium sp. NIES-68]GJP84687.1 hypothetical protein CLOP_g14739 [Closterium sp. NIES-67]
MADAQVTTDSPPIRSDLVMILVTTACIVLASIGSILSLIFVVASRWAGLGQVDFNPAATPSSSSASQGDALKACSFALREGESPYAIFAPSKPSSTRARVQAVLDVALPAAVKAINWAAKQSETYAPWFRPSHWLLPTDMESMLRIASWGTGLKDFGDTGFLTGLALCVRDTETHANLTPFGRIAIWLDVQRMLQGRLRLVDCRKRFPEIEEEQIRAPMVILGMPRTGTTLLYNLLSLDYERFRAPRSWECRYVYPPPQAETFRTDPRIALMDDSLRAVHAVIPDLHTIHPMYPEGPQETFELMCYDMTSFVIPFTHITAPSYLEWFMRSDITPTYEFLKWQLKYLQWRGPKAPQWLLKSPEHIFSLRSMLKVFPDARIICTHRDPVKVISSAHSLMRCFRSLTADPVDNRMIAPLWAPHLARALDDMIDLREAAALGANSSGDEEGAFSGDEESADESGDDSSSSSSSTSIRGGVRSLSSSSGRSSRGSVFAEREGEGMDGVDALQEWDSSLAVDVRFHEFVRSPIGEIKRIYAHFGDELSPVAEARMQRYLDEDRLERKAHRHVYKWEDTCLDKDEQRRRFARYVKYFNVAQEG